MNWRAYVVLALAPAAFAAVDGVVTNETTGKPQAGVTVTLVQPGAQGMQTLGRAQTDAHGKFAIDKQAAPGPQLIQAEYEGVTYNKMIVPGTPTSGVLVDVYDSSTKPGEAKVEQHMVLYQPRADGVVVNETFMWQNPSKVTFHDTRDGTLRFYVEPGAKGDVRVTITAPGGMPIQRPAEETNKPNVYKVTYPIKPGETRIDLAYNLATADPLVVEGRSLYKGGPTRLVVPNGVTLAGDNLVSLGREPQTQAGIYEVKGDAYRVTLAGAVAEASADAAGSGAGEDDGAPQIQVIKPHVYDHLPTMLALAGAILALGTVVLYRSDAGRRS